jgi:uncharacterized membrane protein
MSHIQATCDKIFLESINEQTTHNFGSSHNFFLTKLIITTVKVKITIVIIILITIIVIIIVIVLIVIINSNNSEHNYMNDRRYYTHSK